MGMDAGKTGDHEMELDLGAQIEEILEEQVMGLESRVRLQLEEKALAWVEEECKKRLETLREKIREEIQKEVESWIEGELARRMEDFKRRNDRL